MGQLHGGSCAQDAGEPVTTFSQGLDADVLLAPTHTEGRSVAAEWSCHRSSWRKKSKKLPHPRSARSSSPRYRQEDAQEVPIAITTLSSVQLGARWSNGTGRRSCS
jgi:hypothetical protein